MHDFYKTKFWNPHEKVFVTWDDIKVHSGYKYDLVQQIETNLVPVRYIGMKDKNGKEIFEGDIIKMHQFLFDGSEIEKEHQGVVEYKEETMSFNYTFIKGDWYSEYTGYADGTDSSGVPMSNIFGLHEESFEVIGNTYQNPELV